jgi:hypothetical protein
MEIQLTPPQATSIIEDDEDESEIPCVRLFQEDIIVHESNRITSPIDSTATTSVRIIEGDPFKTPPKKEIKHIRAPNAPKKSKKKELK